MTSSLDTTRNASLIFLMIGSLNWGVTAISMLTQDLALPPPDLIYLLLKNEASVVQPVQIGVYLTVAAAGAFYSMSYLLPRCFPTMA